MTQNWTIETLIKALGPLVIQAPKVAQDVSFGSIVTDSRKVTKGCVFIALKGERFDGHDYAKKALELGAGVLILERSVGSPVPEIIVQDTEEAYGAIASAWRSRFAIPVIEIVGSNGKTTTTQMIASIMRAAVGNEAVCATQKNFNNAVGVPMTLLSISDATRIAVVESGMNHPGEMAQLASWIRPTVVVVTNAQREHQEFLETVEGTARENGLAIVALSTKGTAVLPATDACLPIWYDYVRSRGCRLITYCEGEGAARVRAITRDAVTTFMTPRGNFDVELNVTGRHVVHDAAAAVAAALDVNVPLEKIKEGLEDFMPLAGRGARHTLTNGTVVIDESYNANPDSMRAAIDVLASMPTPRILIAGEMGEIGVKSEAFHAEIGKYAKEHGIERLYATGLEMRAAVRAFGSGAHYFETVDDLLSIVLRDAQTPCTMLVKGSHYVGLTQIVDTLLEMNKH